MKKRLSLLVLAGAMTLAALPALAQTGTANGPVYGYGPMWRHGWGGGWGWFPGMIFGPLMMLIVVVAAIVLLVWLMRGIGHGRNVCPRCGFGGRHGALDTLEQRFAKGEIDKDEFEEKRRVLRS